MEGRMKLKDILVFLDVGTAGDERLRLATRITRDHQACLSAIFLLDEQTTGSSSSLGVPGFGLAAGLPTPSASDISSSAVLAESAEQRFRDWLRSFRIEGDWYPLERTDTAELVTLAQAVDLIIIGQMDLNARLTPTWRPEEVVVACGRPVLMVPYAGSFAEVGRRVLVAWDGSREAVRALNDALPLISTAEVVTVMTVRASARDFERDRPSMERVVRHLARHGIAARADETLRDGIAISDLLLSRAADLSADLIVAGAYHHSPLRETLIGGVSRELFQHMTVPVLMSH
jgi:nucleotide-binding universal stress UspA family protein